MPLPNFHSCRLEDPSKFEKGSFRTIKRGETQLIIGRLKGSSKTRAQAVRYPASMDADTARAKCKLRKGISFEPAKAKEVAISAPAQITESEVVENMSSHPWMDISIEISTIGVRSSFHFFMPNEQVLLHVKALMQLATDQISAYEPEEEEESEEVEPPEVEEDASTVQEAVWDQKYINDLPDSAFAIILPGGKKDESGKTVPRSLRKLPHHSATGTVDLPHLRNALARLAQTDMPAGARKAAGHHLDAHAKKAGVGKAAESL